MEDFDPVGPPALSSFPQTPEQFEEDPRISFSKVDQKWILEADDGTEFEWDQALKRWIPSVGVLASSTRHATLRVKAGDAHGFTLGGF